MHKKNIPSNHELSVPKPSSSKLANFAAGAFIAINLLASSPTYSQNTKTADDMKNKNTTEKTYIVTAKDNKTLKIDTINLDKIITSPIKWLSLIHI